MALIPHKVAISIVIASLLLILWWIIVPFILILSFLSWISSFILLVYDFSWVIIVLINTLFMKVVRTPLAVLIEIELLCLRIFITSSIFILSLFWWLNFRAFTWLSVYWVIIWLLDEGIFILCSWNLSTIWRTLVKGGGCLSHSLWAWHWFVVFLLLEFV